MCPRPSSGMNTVAVGHLLMTFPPDYHAGLLTATSLFPTTVWFLPESAGLINRCPLRDHVIPLQESADFAQFDLGGIRDRVMGTWPVWCQSGRVLREQSPGPASAILPRMTFTPKL